MLFRRAVVQPASSGWLCTQLCPVHNNSRHNSMPLSMLELVPVGDQHELQDMGWLTRLVRRLKAVLGMHRRAATAERLARIRRQRQCTAELRARM